MTRYLYDKCPVIVGIGEIIGMLIEVVQWDFHF